MTSASNCKIKSYVNRTSNVTDESDIIIGVFASLGLHMMPPLLKKPVFAGFLFFTLAWGVSRRAGCVGEMGLGSGCFELTSGVNTCDTSFDL